MNLDIISKKTGISLLIALVSTFIVLILWTFNVFQILELKSFDLRFILRGTKKPREDIVIVAIDDQTFSELDVYPIPRGYYARLIRNLNKANAKAIIFDITFSDYSQYPKQDSIFVQAVKEAGNVVLGEKIAVGTQRGKMRLDSLEPLFPQLQQAVKDTGFIDTYQDDDGFVRQYMVSRKFLDNWFPSLGLTAVGFIEDIPPGEQIQHSDDSFIYGDVRIPLYHGSRILINYCGPRGTYQTISMEQVLDDKPNPNALDGMSSYRILRENDVFKDKIVLIGATFSEAHDEFATPFYLSGIKALTPGVEIHANAVQTILDSDYIYRIGFFLRLLLLLIFGIISGIILTRAKPIIGVLSIIVLIIIVISLSIFLFIRLNIWMDTTDVMGVIFLTYAGSMFYQYLLTRKEKMQIKGMFSHYLAEAVVEELLDNPESLVLGGEERYMTVFFSDIEGFTTISEQLAPTQLARLINEYLTEMTNIILDHKGIIDKYEGDAIMAEFGAPIHFEEHALKACLAALDSQKRLEELRMQWRQQGKPLLKARIGINTGNMVVGNMGSESVFNYTVIGDSVNLGARLEPANKEYATYIMISEQTYKEAKEGIEARYLDKLQVKGKTEPVKVYEVLSRKGELSEKMKELLEYYNQGIKCYCNRDWDKAMELFKKAIKIKRKDGPSNVYYRRSKYLKKNPPDENWEDVTILTTK